eukprot:TRINITY_DN2931_c0_g1_i2.p1 TRINITY_DN2931_c0_g1~~TRINITY_DN2931_c0_g1_i2.p1  ORF type:complete len:235 (+),score=5.70 TRINITY_DN2931_c0_g1_i2:9-713(+)
MSSTCSSTCLSESESSEEEGVRPPLTQQRAVELPFLGYGEGWWGGAMPPSKAGLWHQDLRVKVREMQRKRDKARKSDPVYAANKHQKKVDSMLVEGGRFYDEDEILRLARAAEMKQIESHEKCGDYILFSLPQRGVIHCPRSGLDKISSAVAVRADQVTQTNRVLSGPLTMSPREFTRHCAPSPPPFHPAPRPTYHYQRHTPNYYTYYQLRNQVAIHPIGPPTTCPPRNLPPQR